MPIRFHFWLAALHKLGELWSRNSGEMACCWAYPVGPAKHVLSLAACEHWLLFQRRKVIANVLTCLTEVYRLCVFALCLLLREASEWFRMVKIIGLFLLLAAWQQQLENISGEMEKGRLPAIKLSNQASQLMAWSRTSSLVRSGSIGRYYASVTRAAKPSHIGTNPRDTKAVRTIQWNRRFYYSTTSYSWSFWEVSRPMGMNSVGGVGYEHTGSEYLAHWLHCLCDVLKNDIVLVHVPSWCSWYIYI